MGQTLSEPVVDKVSSPCRPQSLPSLCLACATAFWSLRHLCCRRWTAGRAAAGWEGQPVLPKPLLNTTSRYHHEEPNDPAPARSNPEQNTLFMRYSPRLMQRAQRGTSMSHFARSGRVRASIRSPAFTLFFSEFALTSSLSPRSTDIRQGRG
jgi:hypothetical protein